MGKLWKEILSIIDSLLLPPLSDQPSEMKPLSGQEVDIVLKWLKVPPSLTSVSCINYQVEKLILVMILIFINLVPY